MASTPSCDPGTIVKAADCFQCIPKVSRRAVKNYLLCQTLIKASPPCTTPKEPKQGTAPRGMGPTATTITFTWAQPPNSGTLIVGYKVFWGTTMGGPYPNNSGLLPVAPKQYTITGLSPSTQYFYVIQAIGAVAGCNSINSTEATQTTTGCVAGANYVNGTYLPGLAVFGGNTPSVAVRNALATLYCGLQSDGVLNDILYMNVVVPNDINTVSDSNNGDLNLYRYPFILTKGGTAGTQVPINAGETTINGSSGVPANNEVTDTNFTLSTDYASPTNSGWFSYDFAVTQTGFDIGAYDNTFGVLGAAQHSDGNAYSYNGAIATNVITLASPGAGFYSGQRVSSTDHRFYFGKAGSPVAQIGATDAVAWNGAYPALHVWHCGVNDNGASQFRSSNRFSARGLTNGLTLAKVTAVFARLDTFRRTVGGGFV